MSYATVGLCDTLCMLALRGTLLARSAVIELLRCGRAGHIPHGEEYTTKVPRVTIRREFHSTTFCTATCTYITYVHIMFSISGYV